MLYPSPFSAVVTDSPPSPPMPSLKTLVVGSNLELNIEVTVSNDGEDSYGTTVTLFYPEGLSYLRVARQQVFSLVG